MCQPWVGDRKFLAVSNKFSTLQIIANHHMQSISFASGGDPVSMPGSPSMPCGGGSPALPRDLGPSAPQQPCLTGAVSSTGHSRICCLRCQRPHQSER